MKTPIKEELMARLAELPDGLEVYMASYQFDGYNSYMDKDEIESIELTTLNGKEIILIK